MLSELKAQHREVARLTFEGFKPTEIADQTGIKIATIYQIMRDPLFKAHLDSLSDRADDQVVDVRRELAKLNAKAIGVLTDLLENDGVPHATQLKAAQDILDRNGYSPKQQVNHVHAYLTRQDLDEIKERARAARQGGQVVAEPDEESTYDASPEEVFMLESSQSGELSCQRNAVSPGCSKMNENEED